MGKKKMGNMKTRLGRPRRCWEDNIKMDLKEIWWEGVHWNNLTQDTNKWWAP
jgi:hypothetical protein